MHPPYNRSSRQGISITEVIVILVVATAALYIMMPLARNALIRGCGGSQVLSNAKQLHLATQQMALDGITTGDTNLSWPGDLGTFSKWAHQLINEDYLTTNDFRKLMSAPGVVPPEGVIPNMSECGLLIYAVSTNSPDSAVFATSANFTNTPEGGLPPGRKAKPYGDRGFVVFRKGGDGAILRSKQTGAKYTNIIGAYAPLCR